jgi:outer membrane protein assembly factor BamB
MARATDRDQSDGIAWPVRIGALGLIALGFFAPVDAHWRSAAVGRSMVDPSPAYESPGWRGPRGDGTYPVSGWGRRAARGLSVLWTAEVGEGYASVAILDGLLWTVGRTGSNDVVSCLDAVTGSAVWSREYPSGTGEYPGPLSTPAVDGVRVYVVSREGELHCYGARDGALLWSRRLARELGARLPTYQIGSSPVVVPGGVVVALNSLVTLLDGGTGAPRWVTKLPLPTEKSAGSYATPVPFHSGGRELLAFLGEDALHVLDASTGSVVASHPLLDESRPFANVADPVVLGDLIFVSNGYTAEGSLVRLEGTSLVTEWSSSAMRCQVTTPVLVGGHLYGLDGSMGTPSRFVCLDFATGEGSWSQSTRNGTLIGTRDEIIVVTEMGKLLVARADPSAYAEVFTYDLPRGLYWTPPVLWRDRLYCRKLAGDLVCLSPA